jgi:hypothetical protein
MSVLWKEEWWVKLEARRQGLQTATPRPASMAALRCSHHSRNAMNNSLQAGGTCRHFGDAARGMYDLSQLCAVWP